MKKILLLGLLVCALFGYAQTQVRQGTAADSSFRAFLPEWEKAQSRFINGDPTLWKQHASHREDVTILGGFGGYGEKGWEAVGARYDWASSQYKGGRATLKVEYLSVVVSGDLAYTVGVERQEGRAWATSRTRGREPCGRRKSFGGRTALGNYCIGTLTRFLKSRRRPQPQRNRIIV